MESDAVATKDPGRLPPKMTIAPMSVTIATSATAPAAIAAGAQRRRGGLTRRAICGASRAPRHPHERDRDHGRDGAHADDHDHGQEGRADPAGAFTGARVEGVDEDRDAPGVAAG